MIDIAGSLTIASPTQLSHLQEWQVVLLESDIGPLEAEQEQALCTFVERGGGLVLSGNALEAYHEYPQLSEVIGPVHGFCTARCELIIRKSELDHPITRRAEPAFTVNEEVFVLDSIPSDAQVLWRVTWRYASYALAYTREYGQGHVFCTTLGSSREMQEHHVFQQMRFRAIHYAATGVEEERPLNVAMIGYGAIGFEHGTAISAVPGLKYELVCDRNEKRLALASSAFPGVRTCTDLHQVAEDPDIDVVIVSTPPNTHVSISMQMLQAGKHVVSEKPFCLTGIEAEEMIKLAKQHKRALTVYQCRRWDADYLAIQRVLKQGTIGSVFHVETFIGGYAHPCDYWHSHESISGGVFYDWGSHYLDWILNLIADPVEQVRGMKHKRVWHDVTNADQSSVSLRFAGGQEALFIHSDIAAALKPKWYILGTQGAIVGHWRHEVVKTRRWSGDLIEEHLAPAEALPEIFVYTRDAGDIIHEQHLTLAPTPAYAFHRNLANHLHNGEPLAVSAEEARRNILVMEAAKYSAEHGGVIVSLNC